MNVISKWIRGSSHSGEPGPEERREVIPRRSNGLHELTRSLNGGQGMRVLDLGPTSPTNIAYFTGLEHRIYHEDVLLAALDPALTVLAEDGRSSVDAGRFVAENLVYEKELFDAVLCWDIADYLDAELVKPVIERIHRILKPKGLLLGFFHTRDAGPEAPYYRYHIGGPDTLELQRIPPPLPGQQPAARYRYFRLQRIFNNRHIENLFHDFASIKFFLGRDNIREVLVVR